jgi:hypothetical protein
MGGGGVIGALAWQQANVNELTDHDNRDPLSGFPVFKALLCQVSKVADHTQGPARGIRAFWPTSEFAPR